MHNRIRGLLLVGLVGALVGCGSSSPSSESNGSGGSSGSDGGSGGSITATFDVDGDVTVAGTATTEMPSADAHVVADCADYADGGIGTTGGTEFVIPEFPGGGDVGGRKIEMFGIVPGYNGPGSYDVQDTNLLSLDVDGTVYSVFPESAGTIVTKADGSGSFTFTKLLFGGQRVHAVSGSVTWTCA